jgi:hypothetical protein
MLKLTDRRTEVHDYANWRSLWLCAKRTYEFGIGTLVLPCQYPHSFIHSFVCNVRHINLANGNVVKQNTSLSGHQPVTIYLPIHNTVHTHTHTHLKTAVSSTTRSPTWSPHRLRTSCMATHATNPAQLPLLALRCKDRECTLCSSLCKCVSFCTPPYLRTNNLDASDTPFSHIFSSAPSDVV